MPKKRKNKFKNPKFKNIPKKQRSFKQTKEKVIFKRQSQFPSFSRFITEALKPLGAHQGWLKRLIFASLILVMLAILTVSLHLFITVKSFQKTSDNTISLAKQAIYWQNIEKIYPNYRDAYFQLALIAYQIGDFNKSRAYLRQAEAIDPNYQDAKKLEKYLE